MLYTVLLNYQAKNKFMIIIAQSALRRLASIKSGQYFFGTSATPKSLPIYCSCAPSKKKQGIKIVMWRASSMPFAAMLAARPTEAELESQAVRTTVTASPGSPNSVSAGTKILP